MSALVKTFTRKWHDFIDRLAQANQQSLGSERLDCCSLDKGEGKSVPEKR